jgi:hypothetical protein
MATKGQSKKGFIIGLVGLVLIILGVLWMTVLFPALNKMPAKLDHTLYFDGNITVPDQTIPGQMVTFPIEEILQQNGNVTQDGALFVHEKYTVKNAITGEELLPYGLEQTLAVDRKTLAIVTDIDEQHRSGYWGPPRGLGEGDTFDLWNPGAHRALTATYVKADTFRDMKVVIFKIDAKDISLGNDSQTQLPLLMDTTITLTIEPKTGVVVDEEALTTTSLNMGGEKAPVVRTYVRYDERTIVDLMDKAKSASKMLTLMQTVVPGVLIGVGAVLVIINIVFTRRKKQT